MRKLSSLSVSGTVAANSHGISTYLDDERSGIKVRSNRSVGVYVWFLFYSTWVEDIKSTTSGGRESGAGSTCFILGSRA